MTTMTKRWRRPVVSLPSSLPTVDDAAMLWIPFIKRQPLRSRNMHKDSDDVFVDVYF